MSKKNDKTTIIDSTGYAVSTDEEKSVLFGQFEERESTFDEEIAASSLQALETWEDDDDRPWWKFW